MTPQEHYDRAIRLGKFVPKIQVVTVKVVEEPPQPPICTVPQPAPEPVELVEPAPVVRPFIAYRTAPPSHIIVRFTAAYFGMRARDVYSERRSANIVKPRHVSMYLLKELTPLSYPQISRAMKRFDHTTALHAVKKIEKQLVTDSELREDIKLLERKIMDYLAACNARSRDDLSASMR